MANARCLEFAHHNLVTENEADLTSAVAEGTLVIPTSQPYVAKTLGAGAEALTLANGEPGQVLVINLAVAGGGLGTLTPATLTGFASIEFLGASDQAVLLFVNTIMGWIILGVSGTDAPPVIN